MDLGELPPHTPGRVRAVGLEPAHRLRLAELGIRPGARLRVTHRAAFGGRVLAVGADRFALDATTCARIQVDAEPA
ncbi:ferrous iron transport protein A [Cellulomonas sp. NPDC058312]|uniref:FeoA family protein n=1 Tax=Cellulomonas sp. NPDC058312 TaxID=3346441 RepID=UPI0036E64C4B